MSTRVAVFSRRSLLAESIASEMARSPQSFEVAAFDPAEPDALQDLRAFQPDLVIVDVLDKQRALQRLSVSNLLEITPRAKIVQVDCNQDQVQIFSSEQVAANRLSDLLSALEQVHANPTPQPHA